MSSRADGVVMVPLNNSAAARGPLSRFWSDDRGATSIEYGLLAAMIAAFLVGALITLGAAEDSMYTAWSNAANGAMEKAK